MFNAITIFNEWESCSSSPLSFAVGFCRVKFINFWIDSWCNSEWITTVIVKSIMFVFSSSTILQATPSRTIETNKLKTKLINIQQIEKYRGYHIGLYHLVIGWHTLECNIWFWVGRHQTATLLYDLTCEVLQSNVCQPMT